MSGALTGALAIAGPLVLHADARPLFDGLSSGAGLAAGLLSGLAGAITLALVYLRRFEPARLSASIAVSAIVAGWGLAQQPSFLPGLTLDEAAAGDATLTAIAVASVIGFVVLAPSLTLLFRLQLAGRFDEGEEDPQVVPQADAPIRPAIPPAAIAAVVGIGTTVTFFAEGLLQGAGIAAMLAGATLAFLLLAAPEEEEGAGTPEGK